MLIDLDLRRVIRALMRQGPRASRMAPRKRRSCLGLPWGRLLLKGMLRVPDDGRTGVRAQVLRTVPVTMEISERRTSHRHRVSTKQDFLVSRTHLEP